MIMRLAEFAASSAATAITDSVASLMILCGCVQPLTIWGETAMAIGYPKNKDSVDNLVGELAQSINRNFRRSAQLKTELDSFTDTQLTNLGYSAGEVTALRAFATDMAQLNNIYTGAAALVTPKDFRPSLRPVWGILGDF
jgi:hypothetical protein